jgi:hypothetical protein
MKVSMLTLLEDTKHAFLRRVFRLFPFLVGLRLRRTGNALFMFRLVPGLHSVFQFFDGLCVDERFPSIVDNGTNVTHFVQQNRGLAGLIEAYS